MHKRYFSAARMRKDGMSLVIVLCSLVLLSALIVAFLGQMATELRSSKLYAEGASARILSQSATNLVIAEIKQGTKGVDPSGKTLAWASQPGMIRTYNEDGLPDSYYKLYSDSAMVGTGNFNTLAAITALSGWDKKKALFTDLNEPVLVEDNSTTVPTQTPSYPILDPSAVGIVEGFRIDGAPVGSSSGSSPAPMPVKWLYVLANGSVIAPDESSGMVATFRDSGRGPDASNPIIGRIAFWTDDETSKININTASDAFGVTIGSSSSNTGTYWDTPKFSSRQDFSFANYQPSQNEFQRYPGHPATVALSSVFPKPSAYTEQGWAEEIYNIAPRIRGGRGSSQGGTVSNGSAEVIVPDPDRLYASVDELLFKPDLSGSVRKPNDRLAFNKNSIKQAAFFLSANSRSPDLNLFNRPRVCIWPISSLTASTHRSPYDQLIAFCSTVYGFPFYFQRSSATSATADLPNAGATGGVLGRNRQLFEYLRFLTSQKIPGYGGTFAAKYNAANASNGTDRDQILTEIFDYIRSTNVADGTVSTPFHVKAGAFGAGSGEVVPIEDQATGTRGFGRFPTIQGASIIFVGNADRSTDGTIPVGQTRVQALFCVNLHLPSAGYSPNYNPNLKLRVSGLENFRWQTADPAGALSTISMGFPSPPSGPPVPNVSATTWDVWGTAPFGGTLDWRKFAAGQTYKLQSGTAIMPSQTSTSAPTTFFEFTGGPVTIEIIGPDTKVTQTVVLDFPDGKLNALTSADNRFPVPMLASDSNLRTLKGRTDTANSATSLITPQDVVRSIVPATGDLRLVVPRGGQLSLTTQITPSNPADYAKFFMPHKNYMNRAMLAHNMRNGDNQPYYGATAGRLLDLDYEGSPKTKTAYTANSPNFTSESARDSAVVPTTTDILGDWDNNIGGLPDGPFINRADEGISGTFGGYTPYYGYSYAMVPPTLFSPNRMMPSAGVFGSLPTGVCSGTPWQTLLFSPHPLQGAAHKGFGSPKAGPPFTSPPDYLLLDLFHMPVVEPYAISEPLSTAGRINMNFQIIPFSYIKRETGIRAVLKAEKLITVPDSESTKYKSLYTTAANAAATPYRMNLDLDKTLDGFRSKFAVSEIFRSPSEICSLELVPAGYTGNMDDYWKVRRLTGDNSRERPYTTIYPRLTTKSNTFTIHIRAQSLKKARGKNSGQWEEAVDQVTGEYRGSQTVERYADPTSSNVTKDYAQPIVGPISDFYKFRILSSKQFAP